MKKTSRTILSTVTACVLVATLGACARSDSGGSDATEKPIKIGGTLGLTGNLSVVSVEYKAVYDFWAQKVNASGGLLGRPVVMEIKNDNSTAATAQSLYQTLITSEHVDLLLGPYATFVGVPVVPLARASRMVLFNGGFVGLEYFDEAEGWMIGTYTYQEPDYSRGLFEAIKGLPAEQRPTKVAILTNNTPFTIVVRDGYQGQGGVVNFAKQAGMQIVLNETYAGTTTDFTAAIQRARSSGADMLVILGLANDEQNIVKAAHVLGYRPKITCVCGAQATTLPNWPQLGEATNGVVGTTTAWPSQKNTGAADIEAFSKARGEPVVPTYDYVAYASLQVLQQAVEGAKTLDQEKLKEYIHSHTFDTAVGKLTYQPNGTPKFSQVVTQTVNGRQVPVWPPEVAAAKLVVQ